MAWYGVREDKKMPVLIDVLPPPVATLFFEKHAILLSDDTKRNPYKPF